MVACKQNQVICAGLQACWLCSQCPPKRAPSLTCTPGSLLYLGCCGIYKFYSTLFARIFFYEKQLDVVFFKLVFEII